MAEKYKNKIALGKCLRETILLLIFCGGVDEWRSEFVAKCAAVALPWLLDGVR